MDVSTKANIENLSKDLKQNSLNIEVNDGKIKSLKDTDAKMNSDIKQNEDARTAANLAYR